MIFLKPMKSTYPLFIRYLALSLCLGISQFPQQAMAWSWNTSGTGAIGLHRSAPQGQTVTVSLPNVVDRVLNDNLSVLVSKNRVGIAQGSLIQSTAPLFPSIRAFYSVEKFKGGEVISGGQPINLDRTTYRPTIAGDYTIHTGGKPLFQIWAAKQAYDRNKFAVDMTRQKTLLDACTSYFTWLKDIERERVAQISVNEAQSQLHLRELRLKADVGTNLEVMQSRTLVRERQNLLLSTRNERSSSAYVLLNHINYPLGLTIQPEGDSALFPMRLWPESASQDPAELFKLAEEKRPDIKAILTQIRENKAQLGAAWADAFPTITVSAYSRGIGQSTSDLRQTRQGMLSVNLNLLQNMGVNTIGNVISAKAKIQDAALNQAKQLQDIQKAISQALLDYNLFKDQLSLEQIRCQETEEAYRIAKARFEAGVALNIEVVQAEATMTAARMALQSAITDYNVGQLRLLYETGQLTPDSVLTAQMISLPPVANQAPPEPAEASLQAEADTENTEPAAPTSKLSLSKPPTSASGLSSAPLSLLSTEENTKIERPTPNEDTALEPVDLTSP